MGSPDEITRAARLTVLIGRLDARAVAAFSARNIRRWSLARLRQGHLLRALHNLRS